ncbi:hypothetical protein M9H77_29822 [Catharanthus roseus]|uniref:Uncharacterized protein n=1 Tax=Catharanthus roseus TaxID=4058 RepID=A0ACB9ZWJ3_CATRO|nr:hypothetical protein M9H77_29822 [Catharanthus roseus]
MYDVSQTVDLFKKVDVLSKKFDQLLSLNTLPTNSPNMKTKAVITLRNGKLIDNKVGEPIKDSELNENEIGGIDMGTKIEKKMEKELASSSNSKTIESSHITLYKGKKTLYHCYGDYKIAYYSCRI